MNNLHACVMHQATRNLSTLSSLEAQSLRPSHITLITAQPELIAVDNPDWVIVPVKNAAEAIEALHATARECQSEFFAVLESDLDLDADWLETLVGQAQPRDGALRSRQVWTGAVYLAGRWLELFGEGCVGDDSDTSVVHGSQVLYRTQALATVGYTPEFPTGIVEPGPALTAQGWTVRRVDVCVARAIAPTTLSEMANGVWQRRFPERYALLADTAPATVCARVLETHLSNCAGQVQKVLATRRYHLLYPALLLALRSILQDLRHLPTFESHAASLTSTIAAAFVAPFSDYGDRGQRIAMYLLEDCADLLSLGSGTNTTFRVVAGDDPVTGHLEDPLSPYCSLVSDLERLSGELLRQLCAASKVGIHMLAASGERDRYEQSRRHLMTETDFRVLIANPPWRTESGRLGVRAGSRWPFTMARARAGEDIPHYVPFPFFLAYTSAVLSKNHIANNIVDCIAEGLNDEEFLAIASGYRPDLILLETSTASIDLDLEYAHLLKEMMPETRICFGGSHASICGSNLLSEHEYLDFTINGELEVATLQLARALRENSNTFEHIKGLSYRVGPEIMSQGKAEAPDFATLPWPERQLLPMYTYDDRPVPNMEWPCLQLTATRGCPYKCSFCLWPQVIFNGTSVRYRTRSVEDVAEEIRWAVDMYGFKSFYLDDDTFNIGKRRMVLLAEALKNKELHRLPWMGMARTDQSDRETFAALKSAGMVGIKFGVESGVQSLVDHIQKDLDLSTVKVAVEDCKALGIQVHLTYSIGLPGETLETIRANFEHVLTMAPDSIQLSMMTPFPGTRLYDEVQQKGQLKAHSWRDFDGNASTVTITEFLSKEALEEKHGLFLSMWAKFRSRIAPTVVEELMMYSGAAAKDAQEALAGRQDQLPLVGLSVIDAVRRMWPSSIVQTLATSLAATRIAVIGEPAGALALELGRDKNRTVEYVDADAARSSFVKFRALCERSTLKVSGSLSNRFYGTIILAEFPDAPTLRQLRSVLVPGGLLIQIGKRYEGSRLEAHAAAEVAGLQFGDIIDDGDHRIVLLKNSATSAMQYAPMMS